MSDDNLTAALAALDEEVAAVAQFDAARERLVALVEVLADPDDIFQALSVVHERLGRIKGTYDHLEELMVAAGWSMAEPDSLPVELRAAIEAELPHHEEHLARTSEAELTVQSWLAEEAYERGAQRFWASRRATERHHESRKRRRRRGEG